MPNGDPRVFGFPCRFPAGLRFDPRITSKVFIRNDFWVRGEPRKNFYPEFPVAAGKGRGGATLPLFRPLGAGLAIEAPFFLRPSATGKSSAAWRRVSAQEPGAWLPAAAFADTAWNGVLVLSTSDESEEAAVVFRLEEG